MTVSRLSPVAHDVESSNDFADGEESKDFSGSDTVESQVLLVGAAQTTQKALGGGNVHVAEVGRVAENVDDRLEVGLESSQVTVQGISGLGFYKSRVAAYGGVIFWPRKTSLASSIPTFE